MKTTTCPFCNVKNNERNTILKSAKHSIVLMSNMRKVPGQVLVIPKRHIERFSELTTEERSEVFDLVAEAEKKIIKKFGG
jgi:diadenosine tetraphosphate (Ap4A) HIT family hydrolase